uniref:Fibronectin type-III domain-containing protein n=1 Tax=Ditylenchus dipsaci TaxID=166011 RepID=A0A915ED97_9BILA
MGSVDECCRRHDVPEVCVNALCYPSRPPGDFDVYDIFERKNNCSKHLHYISQCLADGRDHSACCSSEAKDRDEHACFSLCKGEGRSSEIGYHHHSWTQYQTCLAINLPSMFRCFEKGYQSIPSSPMDLTVDQNKLGARGVDLTWSRPAELPNLVDHYLVLVRQLNDEGPELQAESRTLKVSISNLEPGTSYTARVLAVTITDEKRSLASAEVQFQTVGVPPEVEGFKKVITVSKSATSALLACRFQISGVSEQSKLQIQWQHRSGDQGEYNTLSDFRCLITDEFGRGDSVVELKLGELISPSATPPPTTLACCKQRGVEPRCLLMCGAHDIPTTSAPGQDSVAIASAPSRRYVPRPVMPSGCSVEISKVLSCAMPEVDDSACCLRQKVPKACMYLCDSSVEPSNQMAAVCLEHVSSVEQCRIAGVEKRPSAVQNLRIQNSGSATSGNTALVSWEPSINPWLQKSQVTTNRKVINADEIVVVAANSYGISQPAKLVLSAGGKWSRSSV